MGPSRGHGPVIPLKGHLAGGLRYPAKLANDSIVITMAVTSLKVPFFLNISCSMDVMWFSYQLQEAGRSELVAA